MKFIGKQDHISDLFGEKINALTVADIFKKLLEKHRIHSTFYMLAPQNQDKKTFYTIYLQSQKKYPKKSLIRFRDDFEKELRKNFHYDYCRKIHQLYHLQLFSIEADAYTVYIKTHREHNYKVGNIKPLVLGKDFAWSKKFRGGVVE